jgi:AraC family transcriptional regulator of adaptative response / DNA-3-methyladenine glycosylase II
MDRDPRPVRAALGTDHLVGPLVHATPGLRVPGTPDPDELATRAVIGRQISAKGAATLAGRLVADYGEPLTWPVSAVTRLFPPAASLAEADPGRLPMPGARRGALQSLAAALASGELGLEEAPIRIAPVNSCWRCRGSAPGRRSTSRCVRCETRTLSSPATSASGAP